MAITPPSAEIQTTKAPEKKKLKKRAGKKEVKGFYYHAAEYQRERQKERNKLQQIASGIAEPFVLHIRAARLRVQANKKGGEYGSAVLDAESTRKLLERGKLSDADKAAFKAKAQTHSVFEKYDYTNKEDQARAREVLFSIFDKKGTLTDDEKKAMAKETGLDLGDVTTLNDIAKDNAEFYQTLGGMKDKFADSAIMGSLTPDQQKLARQLAKDARWSTVLTTLNYAKIPALAVLFASNPAGWIAGGAVVGSAAFSSISRLARLNKEGAEHDISKSMGKNTARQYGVLNKIFSVDWDTDPQNRKFQLARAFAAGTLTALGLKFAPTILEHAGQGWTDLVSHHLPHPGAPGGGGHDNALYGNGGPKGGDSDAYGVDAAKDHGHDLLGPTNEHLSHYSQNVNTRFLPDTPHHDWQQLHSYAQKDAHGNYSIRLDYQGQDDGGQAHYIDLMMDGTKTGAGMQHVFIENNQTLAVSGAHADDLIKIYGVVHQNGHDTIGQIGTMHSSNLAHQLGLTNQSMERFYTLTQKADGGLWHGTQHASDLQTIMYNRGIFNDGANGQGLYGVRIGGGYFHEQNGHMVFRIGASNHYFDHKLLNDAVIKSYAQHQAEILKGDDLYEFHSHLAPGLRAVDNVEDRGLEWLRENIFRNNVVRFLDNTTDFGLQNMDRLASAMESPLPKQIIDTPWLLYPYLSTPYLASGVAGYWYGRRRKNGTTNRAGRYAARTVEAVAVWALPGAAVTAAAGRLLALIGKPKAKEAPAPKASPETKPAQLPTTPPSVPSDTSPATNNAVPMAQPVAGSQVQTNTNPTNPVPPMTRPVGTPQPTQSSTPSSVSPLDATAAAAAGAIPATPAETPETQETTAPLDSTVAVEGRVVPQEELSSDFSRVDTFHLIDLITTRFDLPESQKAQIRAEIPRIELEKPVEQWLAITDELRADVVHNLPFFSHHSDIVPLVYMFSAKGRDQNSTINEGEQIFPGQQNFFTGVAALMGAGIDDANVRAQTQASAALALGDAIVEVYRGHDDLVQQLLTTEFSDQRSRGRYVQHDVERASSGNTTLFVLSQRAGTNPTVDMQASFAKIQQELPGIHERLRAGQLTADDAMVIEFLGNGLYVGKLAERIASQNKVQN